MSPTYNSEQQTLEVISKADRFNRWMYETIRPHCHGNILEIGSGVGNISSFFVLDNFQITLSDVNAYYLQQLKNKFDGASNLKSIIFLDLQQEGFQNTHGEMQNFFDTVFLLNVLEHIEHEDRAVDNCKYLLKKGGTLIVLVPAYSWLHSKLDKELHHWRRYSLRQLNRLFIANNFLVKNQFYFNAVGIGAWLYAKVFGLSHVPQKEMKLYNKVVPVAKWIDKIVQGKFGLSAIIIGEK